MNASLEPPPRLSVVIRTHNSWATTRQIVERLGRRERWEIILVDSGSSDLPADAAGRVDRIIHYPVRPFSYGGSLNAGVAAARGEWIWVLSSHCVPIRDDAFEQIEHLTAALPSDVVCVLGATLPAGARQPAASSADPAYSIVRDYNFPGGNPNCLYRATSLRRRPFDEQLLTCEDIEWFIAAKRSGASVAVSKSFPALYATRRSPAVMFRKGLDEYRVGKCLGKPRPAIGWRVFARVARNLAKVLLRRLVLGDFLRKEAYILGWFWAETFLPPFTEADIRRPGPTDCPAGNSALVAGSLARESLFLPPPPSHETRLPDR